MTLPHPDILGALRLRRWVLSSWGAELPAPSLESDASWHLFLGREACAPRLKGRLRWADLPRVLTTAADHDTQVTLLLRAELTDLLAIAAPLGVTPVILKGGAALHDPKRAVSAKDLDLLLPDAEARRLLAALDGAGWQSVGGGTGLHFAERMREGRPPIEVHTTAAPGIAELGNDAWERSIPHPTISGLRLLAPADQIRHLAIHQSVQHASHRGRLRDLLLLSDALEGQQITQMGDHAVDQVIEMASSLGRGESTLDRFPEIAAIWYGMDARAGSAPRGAWRRPLAGWVFDFAVGGSSLGERWDRAWEERLEAKSWFLPLRPLASHAPWLLRPLRSLLRLLWLPPLILLAWVLAQRERIRAMDALAAIDERA